jgi:hypothetical protein
VLVVVVVVAPVAFLATRARLELAEAGFLLTIPLR